MAQNPNLAALSAAVGEKVESLAAAADSEAVHRHVMGQVDALNKQLARVQTIKKIKILPNDLTIEGGELTPTMKVKRKIVNTKYEREIESFYAN